MGNGDVETSCSLRWHYPDQVPGVDTLSNAVHPLSRDLSSPNTLELIPGHATPPVSGCQRRRTPGGVSVSHPSLPGPPPNPSPRGWGVGPSVCPASATRLPSSFASPVSGRRAAVGAIHELPLRISPNRTTPSWAVHVPRGDGTSPCPRFRKTVVPLSQRERVARRAGPVMDTGAG